MINLSLHVTTPNFSCSLARHDRLVAIHPERKSGVILAYKFESLVELIFDQGLQVIGEYLSQIDSQYRVNFTETFSYYSDCRVEF